jgi:hypothetical protein
MTDVFPWLETEARSSSPQLASFMTAVARFGSEVRAGAEPRAVRRAVRAVERTVEELLDAIVGGCAGSGAYAAAVALSLLSTTMDTFSRAVERGDVGDYQSSYGTAREAVLLLESLGEGSGENVTVLRAAFPSVEPPERLVRPGTIAHAVDQLEARLKVAFDIPLASNQELDDSLTKVERLLDDAVDAHTDGVPALAARLAASLYVRSYDPIRSEVAARDAGVEERLSELLGIEVRRAINAHAPAEELDGLRREAKDLIRATRLPAGKRGKTGKSGPRTEGTQASFPRSNSNSARSRKRSASRG